VFWKKQSKKNCGTFAGLLQSEQGIRQPHAGSLEEVRQGAGRGGEIRNLPRRVDP